MRNNNEMSIERLDLTSLSVGHMLLTTLEIRAKIIELAFLEESNMSNRRQLKG